MTTHVSTSLWMHLRVLFRHVKISHLLLASSVLWIAFGQGSVRASGTGRGVPIQTRSCPSSTSHSTPLESLTPRSQTNISPIQGLGRPARYRGKVISNGLQLSAATNGSARGTFMLNGHYSHLIGFAAEDDADNRGSSSPFGSLLVDDASGKVVKTVYQYDFIETHDRVSFDIDVHGLKSITMHVDNPSLFYPATLDVVASLK